MYRRFKKQARATGDPVRLTKIEGIEAELRSRVIALWTGVDMPTGDEIRDFALGKGGERPAPEIYQAGEIGTYARVKCRQMVRRNRPFVVAYNPSTDPDWPY